jgi:hypothetical protein
MVVKRNFTMNRGSMHIHLERDILMSSAIDNQTSESRELVYTHIRSRASQVVDEEPKPSFATIW